MYTLVDAFKNLATSGVLEKMAETGDETLRVKVAEARADLAHELFQNLKVASWLPANQLARGAMLAAGAAIPLGITGHFLMSKVGDAGDQIRNRVIQTALTLAGLGAGLYGLHQLSSGEKSASADANEVLDEAVTKLATVGVIESILDQLPGTLSEDAKKLASELRVLNQGYGTQILRELSNA